MADTQNPRFRITVELAAPAPNTTTHDASKFVSDALQSGHCGYGPDNPFYGFDDVSVVVTHVQRLSADSKPPALTLHSQNEGRIAHNPQFLAIQLYRKIREHAGELCTPALKEKILAELPIDGDTKIQDYEWNEYGVVSSITFHSTHGTTRYPLT